MDWIMAGLALGAIGWALNSSAKGDGSLESINPERGTCGCIFFGVAAVILFVGVGGGALSLLL